MKSKSPKHIVNLGNMFATRNDMENLKSALYKFVALCVIAFTLMCFTSAKVFAQSNFDFRFKTTFDSTLQAGDTMWFTFDTTDFVFGGGNFFSQEQQRYTGEVNEGYTMRVLGRIGHDGVFGSSYKTGSLIGDFTPTVDLEGRVPTDTAKAIKLIEFTYFLGDANTANKGVVAFITCASGQVRLGNYDVYVYRTYEADNILSCGTVAATGASTLSNDVTATRTGVGTYLIEFPEPLGGIEYIPQVQVIGTTPAATSMSSVTDSSFVVHTDLITGLLGTLDDTEFSISIMRKCE